MSILRRRVPALPMQPLSVEGRKSLRLPLVLGCLALLTATCVPVTEYSNLVVASQRTGDTPAAEAEGAEETQPQFRVVPVPIQGLEQQGRIPEEIDPQHGAAMRLRMAANILLRSGYVESATVQVDPATGRSSYSFNLRQDVLSCANLPSLAERKKGLQYSEARNLALAVVAVEKFNRNAVQRRVEWGLAHALLAVSGKLPEFSLGAAQIKPSTARRAAASGLLGDEIGPIASNDHALAATLTDECKSLSLATAVIAMYACADCNDPARTAISAYGGQRLRTEAVVDYGAVVAAVAALLP